MAYYISSGQSRNGIILSANDMYIYSGGVANNTTVDYYGSMYISSGGVANNTTVDYHGSMYISSGGVANDTTVNSSGRMHIRSGGTANSTTLNSGGYMYISSGGTANRTMVNSSGRMHIRSGGTANSTTVNSGGLMYISSGGTANSTTVNSSGYMDISSGGVANSTTVNDSGGMYISSGGTATDITALDGAGLGITVASNTYIQGTYNGSAFEMKDAYISGYTVNSSGDMYIYSGGVANNTTVNSGGYMYISSGGTANSTTVNHGSMWIYSGGVANSTTVNYGGYMVIFSGGEANSTTVNDGGDMYIRSGGVANNTTVNSSGDVFISSGGEANSTTVNSGGNMYIYGGIANSTTVNYGGVMSISSGGKHTGTLQIESGAVVYAYQGAVIDFSIAERTVEDDYLINNLSVISGTPIYTITVSAEQSDGTYKLAQGAESFTGTISIGDGTTSYGSITVNGEDFIYNDITYSLDQADGNLTLSIEKAKAPAVFIYNSGTLTSSGAVIDGATIVGSGNNSMYISSGGVANSTTVYDGGSMSISSGGVANSTTVNSSGRMHIRSGGTANSTTLNSGGCMRISSGGVANSTTVNSGGSMYIYSGGTANSTTVNSRGRVYISSGGVANSTMVNSGGWMYISSGGKHTGSLQMANGAIVSAYEGSIIDFTVADRTASDGYLINDLSLISGTSTYTITVSAEQADGTYKLAQGAESFTGSITIGDGTTSYGSITVNGDVFKYNGVDYQLTQQNGNLHLSIGDFTPPAAPTYTVSNTALTNQNVTVSATFSNDSVEKEFSYNGKDWQTYTDSIVFTANGKVSFRSQDAAGNYSAVTTYEVTNIDKVAPTLDIIADKTAPTNQNVVLTANVSDGVVEYFNGKNWVAGSTLTVSENGTYQFRVTDEAGNVTEKEIVVNKIDKVAPTLEVTGNATEWTNEDVILTANVSDGVVEYFNGKNWIAGSTLTVSENGTYQFRVTDEAGNVTEKEIVVDKIDKVAPTLDISADKTTPTNQNVVLTATVSDGTVEYYDGKNWVAGSTFEVTANGTYQFRVTDVAGNSVTDSIIVSNIDKVAPTLDITADKTAPTNQNVVLLATVSDGTVEYFANGNWNIGNILIVTKNGTYQFRVTDAAGNSVTDSIVVNNIDKVAPTLEVSGNATEWTNQDVILTANASDGVVEYFDNGEWIIGSSLTVSENGTYQFRVTDEAGNVTTDEVVVDKIDKVAPTLEVSGNATAWTNKDVVLTANVSDGVVEYFDNGEWIIGNSLTVSENGTYQFRVTDLAGNVTTKEIVVDKIDKVSPTLEVTGNATAWTNQDVILTANVSDGVVKYFDNGEWVIGNSLTVSENGTYQFRVTDEAGNITEKSVIVDKIDKVAPTLEVTGNATAWTSEDVILTANVSDGVVEYFDGENWVAGSTLIATENGTYQFRVTDAAGNVTEKSVVVDKIYKTVPDVPDVPEISDYIFIKDSYSAKINGKKQNGVSLSYGWNAFDKILEKFDFTDRTVIIVNSKSVFAAEIDIDGLNTLYGNVMIPTEKTGSYKLTLASKNQVNFIYADNSHMNFELFATVNVKDGASVGTVSGGKLTVAETEKSSVKRDVVTENYSYSKTVAASGKVNISNASAANISGYATVTLDNGTAETLGNADTKISYQRKYVDGIADTITETETYSAKGTATLKNGSEVDNISGFKTVKLTDSFAANIELGDSYTEKITLKKGVENTVVKETFTGTVTLENSKIGSVCGMNKVTASKGFNFIESYEGSNGNDTLTISKNAVLSLGSINFKDGKKDKLVNNGTLILTAEINRGYISGKGEIAACDEVLQSMKYTYGILNLGATADGFRTTKYELADSSAKKAVKWDLKSDYTGWLSGDSDCIDTIDFVKFKTGKESSMIEISGFAANDTVNLVDKKGNVAELTFADGVFKAELAAKTDYILELGIAETEDSMSYTLAVV